MRKVTDNELDKIFREAADRNEPEFDPKDWEDMAKRLDQDDKAALSRSKTLYTVVALLVISTLWSQFNGKDKTQTASVLESPAPTEWKDETLKEEASTSEKDQPAADAASSSDADASVNEEASALGEDRSVKKESVAPGKDQPVKNEGSALGKPRSIQKEDAAIESAQSSKEQASTKENQPITSAKKSTSGKNELESSAPEQDDLSTGEVREASGLDKVGLIEHESAKNEAIVSERANKNTLNKSPTDPQQDQSLPAVAKESAGLQVEGLASEKDGAAQASKSGQGTLSEKNALYDKDTSDKTHNNKEQSTMGEAAAAGNDRLPSSANGEIILMNDGQSQLPVQPQSPPIILEGTSETKKDGSPGIAASSESKVSGNEGTSAVQTLTVQTAEPAGPVVKDSTEQAEKNIAPVQTAADSGTVQKDWKNENQAFSHSWFVKLPVSPDFSSINYTTPGKPGINIGLLGEYSLSRHFSVSTGAIYSKKLYDSKDPDKSYSSGGWTAKASSLNGDCRVLDIPINVTYYMFPESKTNLFVTLGSSSYIMLKEKYVYTVWANHQDYQYEENFSHKNNEWFSMLNISIGIQRRVGEHFFVQAEPFLKAPMSGVGEGKVNLVSTGVFFSLKYKLGK